MSLYLSIKDEDLSQGHLTLVPHAKRGLNIHSACLAERQVTNGRQF